MNTLMDYREKIRTHHRTDEAEILEHLISNYGPDEQTRKRIQERAIQVVRDVRSASGPTLTESFLGEYGLSTDEDLALMTMRPPMRLR